MTCIEGSKATVYGLYLSQVALTLGVLLFRPVPEGTMVSPSLTVHNKTITATNLVTTEIPLSLPAIAASVLALFFSLMTMEQEGNFSGTDYSAEQLDATGTWDHIFWGIFLVCHAIVIFIATSPVDVYALVVAVSFVYHFARRGTAPKTFQTNQTKESINMLGYAVGIMVSYVNIPGEGLPRVTILVVTALLDYMLAVGHTWDNQATLETVANCRLVYTCVFMFFNCAIYFVWDENLKT